jgi:peptide deformylase
MTRGLVLYGDPVLRKVAQPVTDFDEDLKELVGDMYRIMYEEQGIGLAGPQVGDLRRVFVIDVPADEETERVRLTMVNPEIVERTGKSLDEEGCLSIPGIREKVERPGQVTVRFQDETGEEYEAEATDLVARAILHENDHLDGILFVDRISAIRRSLLKRQLADIAAGKVPRESER